MSYFIKLLERQPDNSAGIHYNSAYIHDNLANIRYSESLSLGDKKMNWDGIIHKFLLKLIRIQKEFVWRNMNIYRPPPPLINTLPLMFFHGKSIAILNQRL